MSSHVNEGVGALVEEGWVGAQMVAVFDVKVASPLPVLRDARRTRPALI